MKLIKKDGDGNAPRKKSKKSNNFDKMMRDNMGNYWELKFLSFPILLLIVTIIFAVNKHLQG